MDNEQRHIAQKKNSAAGQKTAAEPLPTHGRNSNGLATTVPAEKSVLVENIDVASTVVSLLTDDVRPHFTPTDGLRVPVRAASSVRGAGLAPAAGFATVAASTASARTSRPATGWKR